MYNNNDQCSRCTVREYWWECQELPIIEGTLDINVLYKHVLEDECVASVLGGKHVLSFGNNYLGVGNTHAGDDSWLGVGGMFTDSTYIPQQDYPFLTYCVVKMYQSSIPCASWRLMLDECHIKMTPHHKFVVNWIPYRSPRGVHLLKKFCLD